MDTQGLEGAVKAVQEMAQEAVGVEKVRLLLQGENRGTTVIFPAVLVKDEDGGQSLYDTLDLKRKADDYARELRLRDAAGPDFRTGTAQLQALDSLIAHANRFKGVESAIWADAAARKLVVVMDYHEPGHDAAARWARHRGVYECPLSDAWNAWGGGKDVEVDQETFAAFLDAHDRELAGGALPNGKAAPEPADLITMASTLETYRNAKAKSERDRQTGRRVISFSDESSFLGNVVPPPSFLIKIPVFQDASAQVLEVRLMAAVRKDGGAQFCYRIHAANDVLREAFQSLCQRVVSETGLPLFIGRPEAVG